MIGILLRTNLKHLNAHNKSVFKRRKRGDINYILGIIAVAVVMLIIVAAIKQFTGNNLLSEVTEFIENTLFKHITNPFTSIDPS